MTRRNTASQLAILREGKRQKSGFRCALAANDHDGRIDAFVANDTVPNFLFHNEGGGRFKEVGITAGVGMNDDGRALSSMGTDFRDVDNDGWEDVFVTALANETFPLHRNGGKGLFTDSSPAAVMAVSNGERFWPFLSHARDEFSSTSKQSRPIPVSRIASIRCQAQAYAASMDV